MKPSARLSVALRAAAGAVSRSTAALTARAMVGRSSVPVNSSLIVVPPSSTRRER